MVLAGLGGFSRQAGLLYTDAVLDEPFVDCFCGMSHEDATSEIGLCENVRQRGGMV